MLRNKVFTKDESRIYSNFNVSWPYESLLKHAKSNTVGDIVFSFEKSVLSRAQSFLLIR